MKNITITCPVEKVQGKKTSTAHIIVKCGFFSTKIKYIHDHLNGHVTEREYTVKKGHTVHFRHDIDILF